MWKEQREILKGYNIINDPQITSLGLLQNVEKAFREKLLSLNRTCMTPHYWVNPVERDGCR
jgi:hypothetical protein